ncbi:hypothetical protein BBO_05769 [Beauveria brongniartii RCEF 3172]|uniref:Uncharacterized protein n=1 Tax=Beauveria brongniartii RCEF 3172 TaxID=1081107 RepID=A0A162JFA6_9HYPO|nr:hypothetical protein BBO_05769 [Beauveria brongniartii RCEF 3172]
MDPLDILIVNARGQLGCSGLRNLRDLAQMRQETIEKRFAGAQHLLTVRNTLSIYAAWLWAKAFYEPPNDLHRVMEKWCAYLWGIGCTREMARIAWTEAQVMLGPMSVTKSSPLGALQMKIGSSITMQFPTASLHKRKIAVLQECASHEKQAIKKTTRQEAPLPSGKKHKTSHVSQTILPGSPFRKTVHVCPPSVHASRQGFLSLSPDNKDLHSHFSQNAARRAQEEAEVSRGLSGFRFDFGLNNASRPSVGGSHWSPRQGVARDSQRRDENTSAAQIHRWPVPVQVEEKMSMSPSWAVSVRHPIAPPAPPTQKQMQKQSWQINNIQNQIIKHENASVSQKKASGALKKPRGPTKEVPVAKIGQSSIAKFGALAAEANTQSTPNCILRHEDESGRLSPWEEDKYVVEIPRQATSTVVQAELSNPPLPLKAASLGNTNGATKKASLSHFGTPKGILKPDSKKDRPPHQSCIPSAPAVPAQQNVQHHAYFNPHYTQHHPPHLTQHHALNPNDPGARVAPYPRMHSSPLSQHPILLQQRVAYKPLIGYHPGVTRLFRRRPNVWVHQMSRDVALDTWGDFSNSNQPQEYWAWEEYDPVNPFV